jgi:hypothetical protein
MARRIGYVFRRVVSGFLGIGGALKVLAMDWAIALPIKV